MPNAAPADTLRFGAFEVDLRAGELRKEGVRIKLHNQPFQVLTVLIERAGQLVTREELRQKLWDSNTFVDFDDGLNSAIKKLREALEDSSEAPRFIETAPRRGYRFIAPIDTRPLSTDAQRVAGAASLAERPSRSIPRLWALAVVTAALIAASVLAFRAWRDYTARERIRSIAVLPLDNVSGDPAQQFFADGMTDELITNLAKIKSLRVISRTSTMQFKRVPRRPVREIARTLQVDAVVEGTVLRSGDQVRITAQLIDARSEHHLWAEEYNRDIRDVLALQAEVARNIAGEIRATVTPDERKQLTASQPVDAAAYEAYLKGRYFWNRRTEDGLRKAITYFQQSSSADPNYALAYDGLADCWLALGWYGYIPPREAFPRAKAHAIQALKLDDRSAEAHTTLAHIIMNYEWDWAAAEREFREAIQLNPNYANAHHWYGDYLSAVGRHQEAIAESKRALELDPLSPIINAWLGWRHYFARQLDQAIGQYLKTLEIDENFVPAHLVLGQAYEQKAMTEEAIAELQKAVKLSKGGPLYVASLAHALAAFGRRSEADKLLVQMIDRAQRGYIAPFHIAVIYAGLGDTNRTLAWLEKGYEERSTWMVWLKVDPRFDSMRSDRRFQDLLRRLGLS
jgi:TolB-like protein/DNA-binding winged helix-turn-helix (wHTH) protein/Flp pilus assembly protein TadD